ncbi:uncharacterized protein LOC122504185 [Leptopilina heterotoma]|uniref:uncharacterized protein LOC122504185 n=1 Tax=Leptopilina heterotoma TaxID=63436 RepID=UPI001CA9E9E1|nr:uncharacterized protein LOC122504185 [Leptopilina heterotoma]
MFAKNIRKNFAAKTVSNLQDVTKSTEIEGRRIIHIETLANQLFCRKCESVLSLTKITKEIRVGLASKFYIECLSCKVVNEVCSDKQHDVNNQNKHFDTNTKAVMDANLQVGIVIADNDSSSICAIRNASEHEVVKQADKNHTSKGVVNELYKIQKKHKELTAVTIKYLQRCFSYCVSQNKGNSRNMAEAIKNIPHHCFNDHVNCGTCRRLFLKKNKTELRNKKEGREGTTYATDCGLFERLPVSLPIAVIDEKLQPIVVLFDLETGGFSKTDDILQIAVKCEQLEFSVYIKPTQRMKEEASAVNGLRCIDGNLYLNNQIVLSISLKDAMEALYQFMFNFHRKCVLTAHNCKFDYPRLMRAIKNVGMSEHFRSVVDGFSDTLPIIRKRTGKKGKGKNKLEVLAEDLQLKTEGAHNALIDVILLQQVLEKLQISNEKILEFTLPWNEVEKRDSLASKLSSAMKELGPLNQCVSYAIRKKMVTADVSYDMLQTAFRQNGFNGLSDILRKDENDNVRVTKCHSVIKKIYDFLKSR